MNVDAMAVPNYQEFMRPVLAVHADGREHYKRDLWGAMAEHFALTPEERNALIPSGGQRRYTNRCDWAVTYMTKAGLLERPRRSYTRITQRGREVLERHPERVDDALLKTFPEFLAFKQGRPRSSDDTAPAATESNVEFASGSASDVATPEERIDEAFTELRSALADDLLERVLRQSPEFFERLVLNVLIAIGYGGDVVDAAKRLGGTGDAGIDGVVRQDKLGLDEIYVQAKRWQGSVGRPVLQAFVGALQGARASKGVLIATSTFTAEARRYAETLPLRVILIDGAQLAGLMIDHGVGVSEVRRFSVRRIDTDFFAPDDEALPEETVAGDGPEASGDSRDLAGP